MRRLVVAVIACGLGFAAMAQEAPKPSSDPPSSTQPQGNASRDKATAQTQSAAPPPIIVNVHPAPRTEAEAQKEERERQEKAQLDRRLVELTGDLADYTRWLAYATAALFAVTAGLFIFAILQARDAKRSGDAAAMSANAAKQAAEAAQSANDLSMETFLLDQRPRITLPDRDFLRASFDPNSGKFLCRVIVNNIGKGTARNVHIVPSIAINFPDGTGAEGFRDQVLEKVVGNYPERGGKTIFGGSEAHIDVLLSLDVDEVRAYQSERNTMQINPFMAVVVAYRPEIKSQKDVYYTSALCRITNSDQISCMEWDPDRPQNYGGHTLSYQKIGVTDAIL